MKKLLTVMLLCAIQTSFSQPIYAPNSVAPTTAGTDIHNVGIGTASPQGRLHIKTPSPSLILEKPSSDEEATIVFQKAGAPLFYFWSDNADNDALKINGTQNGEPEGAPRMNFPTLNKDIYMVQSGGRLGIGTNSPTFGRLQVTQLSDASTQGIAILNSTNARAMRLWTDPNNSYVYSGETGQGSLILNGAGNVGIGITTPAAKLHVHNDDPLPQGEESYKLLSRISGRGYNYFSQSTWIVRDAGTTTSWQTTRLHDGISIDNEFMNPQVDTKTWWERDPKDNIQSWGNANQTYMTLKSGMLGIGTIDPDKALTVKGTIHTNEVLVDMNGPIQGPDYVFEKDYPLTPLAELERYINLNKHLPEVPSAKEMEANGLNLKEMNLLLLKKIEELTLHLIKKDKQIEELLLKYDSLKQEIESLK